MNNAFVLNLIHISSIIPWSHNCTDIRWLEAISRNCLYVLHKLGFKDFAINVNP